MSRVGKKPIEIPENVQVTVEGRKVTVKGPKGELSREIRPEIKAEVKDGEVIVTPQKKTKQTKAYWGLTRALIQNMVDGVVKEYEKKLEIQGLGYKANMQGDTLVLKVGYSHSVEMESPEGVDISVDNNIITVSGIDKELVGLTASKIRKVKPPEPYKGKGIRYVGEHVRRKPGKRVATGPSAF